MWHDSCQYSKITAVTATHVTKTQVDSRHVVLVQLNDELLLHFSVR
jgi:hypothetical protein